MKKVNVGIIGSGLISSLHAAAYEGDPRARLYAVCDLDEQLVTARKEEWGAEKAFTDYRELLADPEVDAVEILTPHKLHERMVIEALDAKKHVALQKPMTVSLESADRMVAHARRSDLVFKVTDNYVFYPPIALAKKMIENGDIGDPQLIRMKMINSPRGGWEMPVASYDWRFDEISEGRFTNAFDHGHHEWATAWYLMGEIETGDGLDRFHGWGARQPPDPDVEVQGREEVRHLRFRLRRGAAHPFEVLPQRRVVRDHRKPRDHLHPSLHGRHPRRSGGEPLRQRRLDPLRRREVGLGGRVQRGARQLRRRHRGKRSRCSRATRGARS